MRISRLLWLIYLLQLPCNLYAINSSFRHGKRELSLSNFRGSQQEFPGFYPNNQNQNFNGQTQFAHPHPHSTSPAQQQQLQFNSQIDTNATKFNNAAGKMFHLFYLPMVQNQDANSRQSVAATGGFQNDQFKAHREPYNLINTGPQIFPQQQQLQQQQQQQQQHQQQQFPQQQEQQQQGKQQHENHQQPQQHSQHQQQLRPPLNFGFPPDLSYGYPVFHQNHYPLQPPAHFNFNPLPLYPPLYPGLSSPFFNHFLPPPPLPNSHPPLSPPIVPVPPRRTTRMEAPFMPSQFIGFASNDDRRHPPDHTKDRESPGDSRASKSPYAMPSSKPVYETQNNSPNMNGDPYTPNNSNNLIYMSPNYTYGSHKNN